MRRLPDPPRLLLALGLVLAGCATTLEPAPQANRLPGRFEAATAEAAGVRVVAAAEAWRGFPQNLKDEVVPILVTVQNDSRRAISMRYAGFALEAPEGTRFAALPPFHITERVTEPLPASYAPHAGFFVAPYLAGYYPGWPAFHGPFAYDPWYYDRHSLWLRRPPPYRVVQLPTQQMIQAALPEGVVQPGGAVSGFLYFEKLRGDPDSVVFTARIVDAGSGEELGIARIPFVVD